MKDLLKKFGLDYFILSLFGAIFVAWLYPKPGAYENTISLSSLAKYGVTLIFFFYGVRLNWKKIYTGLLNYRLHLVVHLSTFVLFPLIVLPLTYYFTREGERSIIWLWYGIFFTATLPSTVSSSVVMVNIARGNVPAAIFDASISSLLGVFITPVWMQIFIRENIKSTNLIHVILNLIVLVIIPVIVGICFHRTFCWLSEKYDKILRKFDQGVILLIVYTSFCHSFANKMFDGISAKTLFLLSIGMILLFFTVFFIVDVITHILCFNREDRITALFCGSKKSLVHGATMSKVILPDLQLAGVLLLPTMLYHAYQLIIVSMIAQRFAKQVKEDVSRETKQSEIKS